MQRGLEFGARAEGPAPPRRRAITVSQLNDRVQHVLENGIGDQWVEGEISNVKLMPAGHWFFSLKDDHAQVRAVVWKTNARLLKMKPRDGLKVLVRGTVKVWAPRGEYQLSVEVLEPLGKGALQQAFEDLKDKLGREGLFDPRRKRPLPVLPRRVGVVTSPTGAVVQDIVRVLAQRFANLDVLLYPARVQGPDAAGEVAQGVRVLNGLGCVDVVIVARGGGSLEDLWPFNDEVVARALAGSKVPTISAVGHETDVTIADFVADVRAATPSAAAEKVVQAKQDLVARIDALARRRDAALERVVTRLRTRVGRVTEHRVFEAERGRVRARRLQVGALATRMDQALRRAAERARARLRRADERTDAFRFDRQVAHRRERLAALDRRLGARLASTVDLRRTRLGGLAAHLDALSPLAVLGRGYALAWRGDGQLLRDAREVAPGDAVRVRLAEGEIEAQVTRVGETRDP